MSADAVTSVGYWASRWTSSKIVRPYAACREEFGVVDELVMWDQMTNWWPRQLWRPDVGPMGELIPDIDSLQDPFLACGAAQDVLRRRQACAT